ESAATRRILEAAYESVMVGYNRRHDRQTEPSPAFLGGEVWLKDPGAQARVDAGPIVAHFERHHAAKRIQAAAHRDNRRLAGFLGSRDRIINKIDQRPLQS